MSFLAVKWIKCVITVYLRDLPNMEVGLLFGSTELPQMENHQLVLLLVRPGLQSLQTWTHKRSKQKEKTQGSAIMKRAEMPIQYLNAFKNLSLLIVAQLGEIFLDSQLCSGWIETCKQRNGELDSFHVV